VPISFKAAAAPSSDKHSCTTVDADAWADVDRTRATSFDIMDDIHDSGYLFRMVVVGKGAILELYIGAGTRAQGHTESSTGTNMLTLATDQTFEFLFAVAQVSKMVLLEK
jgi:hypothetical protein